MKSSIILEYYNVLSKVVLNRFTDFVDSPYYNKHLPTKKLHYYLLKETRKEKNQKLEKKIIFQKVYHNEVFNEQKFKNVITSLLYLFEQFIAAEALKKDDFSLRALNIKESLKQNLIRNTKKYLTKAFAEKDKSLSQQTDILYHSYILNDLAYSYEEQFGKRVLSSQYLQQRINFLDEFYFAEKMLTGAAMLNRAKILNTSFEMMFFNEVKQHGLKREKFKNTSISININLYLLLETEEEFYFDFIKKEIKNLTLTKDELNLYYSFLRNYAIRKINSGNQSYLQELFHLNKEILENDLLIQNNSISEWTYKNFISLGLRLKKFDWTQSFIKKYSHYLDSKIYENAYNYNLSNLLYAQEKYDEAMHYLIYVNYTDVMYLLDGKALLLKIYFEIKEFEALDSLLHSFRLLTMRQSKIAAKQKNAYLNMIKTTSLLLALKIKKSTYTKEKQVLETDKIKEKVLGYKNIANKSWLLEKLNEV